jgi:Tfp pilus assembly protein PilZ
MTDKRSYPRFGPLVIKASFHVGSERRVGYLTNVSEGGAFLAVDDPPQLGAKIEIHAALPWRLGELRASTRVAWRSEGGAEGSGKIAGVGLAFETVDPLSREHLYAYLERFASLAARIEEMQEG